MLNGSPARTFWLRVLFLFFWGPEWMLKWGLKMYEQETIEFREAREDWAGVGTHRPETICTVCSTCRERDVASSACLARVRSPSDDERSAQLRFRLIR
jgi:hypothetical protein